MRDYLVDHFSRTIADMFELADGLMGKRLEWHYCGIDVRHRLLSSWVVETGRNNIGPPPPDLAVTAMCLYFDGNI